MCAASICGVSMCDGGMKTAACDWQRERDITVLMLPSVMISTD